MSHSAAEWARLVADDVQRMARVGRLKRGATGVNEFLLAHAADEMKVTEVSSGGSESTPLTAWIEPSTCADFPAVEELLERLYVGAAWLFACCTR